jgi:hypothetical protein
MSLLESLPVGRFFSTFFSPYVEKTKKFAIRKMINYRIVSEVENRLHTWTDDYFGLVTFAIRVLYKPDILFYQLFFLALFASLCV